MCKFGGFMSKFVGILVFQVKIGSNFGFSGQIVRVFLFCLNNCPIIKLINVIFNSIKSNQSYIQSNQKYSIFNSSNFIKHQIKLSVKLNIKCNKYQIK